MREDIAYYKDQFGTPTGHAYRYVKTLRELQRIGRTVGRSNLESILVPLQVAAISVETTLDAELSRAALNIKPEYFPMFLEANKKVQDETSAFFHVADVTFGEHLKPYTAVTKKNKVFTANITPENILRRSALQEHGLAGTVSLDATLRTPDGEVPLAELRFEEHFPKELLIAEAFKLWNRQRGKNTIVHDNRYTNTGIDLCVQGYSVRALNTALNKYLSLRKQGKHVLHPLITETILSTDIDADYLRAGTANTEENTMQVGINAVAASYVARSRNTPLDIVEAARDREIFLINYNSWQPVKKGQTRKDIALNRLRAFEAYPYELFGYAEKLQKEHLEQGLTSMTYTSN